MQISSPRFPPDYMMIWLNPGIHEPTLPNPGKLRENHALGEETQQIGHTRTLRQAATPKRGHASDSAPTSGERQTSSLPEFCPLPCEQRQSGFNLDRQEANKTVQTPNKKGRGRG